jgi:hypothetical protein
MLFPFRSDPGGVRTCLRQLAHRRPPRRGPARTQSMRWS